MIGGFRVYIHNCEWVIEPAIYFNTVLFLNAKKKKWLKDVCELCENGWGFLISLVLV